MTLWTVYRQHVHSTAAVFMPATLLKGCNLSHFLLRCQVYAILRGGLASFLMLPILSCVSNAQFRIRLHNLSLFVTTWIHISQIRAPIRGWEEPAMWSRIWVTTRRERQKKGQDNKWDGKRKTAPHTFPISCERTAKSKIWPIRQWDGEANSNP